MCQIPQSDRTQSQGVSLCRWSSCTASNAFSPVSGFYEPPILYWHNISSIFQDSDDFFIFLFEIIFWDNQRFDLKTCWKSLRKGSFNVDWHGVTFLHRSNLEVLTLGRGFLSDEFFFLLAGCNSLQSLSITDATLGSGGAQEIQLRHESLCSLQIVKCRVLRIAIRLAFFFIIWIGDCKTCCLFFVLQTFWRCYWRVLLSYNSRCGRCYLALLNLVSFLGLVQ